MLNDPLDLSSRVAGTGAEEEPESRLGEKYAEEQVERRREKRGAPVLQDWYRVALGKRTYEPRFGLTTNNQESLSKGAPPVAQSYVQTRSDYLARMTAEVGAEAAVSWLDAIITAPERYKSKIAAEVGVEAADKWWGAVIAPPETPEEIEKEVGAEAAVNWKFLKGTPGVLGGDPTEDWDYRLTKAPDDPNAPRPLNNRGEELPPGALQFDPDGYAYYGEGWEGLNLKVSSTRAEAEAYGWGKDVEGADKWWQQVYERMWGKYSHRAIRYKVSFGIIMDLFQMWDQQRQVEFGSKSLAYEQIAEETGKPTYDEIFNVNLDDIAAKLIVGLARGRDPYRSEKEIESVKRTRDVMERISIARNTFNSIRTIGALVRGETTIKGIHQAIEDNKDIARMAYSLGANENEVRREFYHRVNDLNEDPNLVAMDMDQPLSQFVGYFIMDPLNLLDIFLAPVMKFGRMGKAAKSVMRSVDEVFDVVEGFIHMTPELAKADQLTVVKGLVDLQPVALKKFSTAVAEGMARKSVELTKKAARGGLFYRYGASRQTKVLREIETFARVILQTSEGADKVGDIVELMARIGSGDIAQIERAVPSLIKILRNPNMAFSESGLEFAKYAARMLDDGEGGIDAVKFFRNIKGFINDGDELGLINHILKLTDNAIMAEYPTVKDIIKTQEFLEAGGDISKAHPGAVTFLANDGKIRPIDRAIDVAKDNWWQKMTGNFAGRAYIGTNPFPMVRGATFDTLRSSLEMGVEINMHSPRKWAADGTKWLGGMEHPGLMQGFSKADVVEMDVWAKAQSGYENMGSLWDALLNRGVDKKGWRLSKKLYEGLTNPFGNGMQWFEMKHSQRVVGKASQDSVIHAIKTGLMKVDELITAGLPKNVGKLLEQRLINAFGDSDVVKLDLLKQLNTGEGLDVYTDLSWATEPVKEVLRDLHIWDDVLEAIKFGTKTDNKNALGELLKAVLKKTDEVDRLHVRGDITKGVDDVLEAVGQESYEALKKGWLKQEDIDELGNIVQQNRHTINAVDTAIGEIKRVVELRIRKMTGNDPVAFKQAMEQIDLAFDVNILGNWDNLVGASGAGNDKLWGGFVDGLMNLPEEKLPAHVDEIWRWFGFDSDVPTVYNRSEIKDHIWRAWKAIQKTDFATYRMGTVDEMYKWIDGFSSFAPQGVIDEVLQLKVVEAVRINAQRAAELDHVIMVDGVMKPIAGVVRKASGIKENAVAVRGIGSYMSPYIEMIVRGNDLNDTYILQIINKYSGDLFSKLDDIPPEVAFDAFQKMRVDEGFPELFKTFEDMVGYKPGIDVPDELTGIAKVFQDYSEYGETTATNGKKLIKFITDNDETESLSKILATLDDVGAEGVYDEVIELAKGIYKGKIDDVAEVIKPLEELLDTDIVTIYRAVPEGVDITKGRGKSWTRDIDRVREFGEDVYTKQVSGTEWKEAVARTLEQAGVDEALEVKAGVLGMEEGIFTPEFAADAQLMDGLDDIIDTIPNIKPPYDDQAVTTGRHIYELGQEKIEAVFDSLIAGVENNYGKREYAEVSDDLLRLIDDWFENTGGRMDGFRASAAKYAQSQRDLVLHDYTGDRFGFDGLMSNMYQFHFWPSRTAVSFVKTIPYSMGKINKFAQTRNLLGQLHSDAPEWYRYTVNTNEIFGTDSDNPIFFDFMNAIMPFNNLMGGFDTPAKRVNWYSALYDGMGKSPFGYPNIGLGLLVTLALKIDGEDEAAQLTQGRLFPITGFVKGATALAGVDEGKGIEIDPMVRALSEQGMFGEDVLEYWEIRRVINMVSLIAAENPELRAQAYDEIRARSGPIWNQAIIMSRQKDALGLSLSAVTGMNARLRTKDDLTVDQFWTDYIRLWAMSENMTGEEFRRNQQLLNEQYPFAELMMLGRRGKEDRDVSYTYAVLTRVEPGTLDNLWEAMGFNYDMFSDFYEEKGFPESWTEDDKNVFMSGVLAIGAALEIPITTTKTEWNEARIEYQVMRDEGIKMFGENIWELVDGIYEHKEVGVSDQTKWQEYLELFPVVEVAMDWRDEYVLRSDTLKPYYGGMDKYRSYLKGVMYAELEEKYGEEIFDKNLIYQNLMNAKLYPEAKNYLSQHEDLKAYRDERPGWYDQIEDDIVEFGDRLPEGKPSEIRESFDPASFSEFDLQKYFERYQAPTYTRDEWIKKIGGPEVNMLLNAFGGLPLDEDIRDYLAGIAAEHGLSLNELQDAVGNSGY